ncbi:MAG: DUF2269 domain-containing protein [Lysobacteraceae bacterium]|nr:MAG: DUF2269 domain-containing protein [Xanthomonadaceae bacterium]
MSYLLVKWLHIVSSTILFGTGIGSAFYLLCASLSRDARLVARVAAWVVRADWLFTATTIVLQPVTGWWLMRIARLPIDAWWLEVSIVLYVLAVACWLPVVWLQIRMRDLAVQAARKGAVLPSAFHRCFLAWFALGVPALLAFLAIFYLMVAKPGGP